MKQSKKKIADILAKNPFNYLGGNEDRLLAENMLKALSNPKDPVDFLNLAPKTINLLIRLSLNSGPLCRQEQDRCILIFREESRESSFKDITLNFNNVVTKEIRSSLQNIVFTAPIEPISWHFLPILCSSSPSQLCKYYLGILLCVNKKQEIRYFLYDSQPKSTNILERKNFVADLFSELEKTYTIINLSSKFHLTGFHQTKHEDNSGLYLVHFIESLHKVPYSEWESLAKPSTKGPVILKNNINMKTYKNNKILQLCCFAQRYAA
jgi:hypothetical protein